VWVRVATMFVACWLIFLLEIRFIFSPSNSIKHLLHVRIYLVRVYRSTAFVGKRCIWIRNWRCTKDGTKFFAHYMAEQSMSVTTLELIRLSRKPDRATCRTRTVSARPEQEAGIGGSRIFLGGVQRRVHPDVYWLHISEDPSTHAQLITVHILAKLHSHHYPGLLGRFRSRRGLQNNSEIVLKLI